MVLVPADLELGVEQLVEVASAWTPDAQDVGKDCDDVLRLVARVTEAARSAVVAVAQQPNVLSYEEFVAARGSALAARGDLNKLLDAVKYLEGHFTENEHAADRGSA